MRHFAPRLLTCHHSPPSRYVASHSAVVYVGPSRTSLHFPDICSQYSASPPPVRAEIVPLVLAFHLTSLPTQHIGPLWFSQLQWDLTSSLIFPTPPSAAYCWEQFHFDFLISLSLTVTWHFPPATLIGATPVPLSPTLPFRELNSLVGEIEIPVRHLSLSVVFGVCDEVSTLAKPSTI